jgi:hypothetical protein
MPNIVFMPAAGDVLLLSLVLYFVSATGTQDAASKTAAVINTE